MRDTCLLVWIGNRDGYPLRQCGPEYLITPEMKPQMVLTVLCYFVRANSTLVIMHTEQSTCLLLLLRAALELGHHE